jgi:anaerobic selenocysteine-containing dehydrogenase
MNHDDMRERGLSQGEAVDLVGRWEGKTRVAEKFLVVPYQIPKSNCATYFPEANVLVPVTSVAEKSNTPTYKYVVITVRKRART